MSNKLNQRLINLKVCPVRGCNKPLTSLPQASRHILTSHIGYLNDFLKKDFSSLNVKECLIRSNKKATPLNPEVVDIVEEDEVVCVEPKHPLLEKWEQYCTDRNLGKANFKEKKNLCLFLFPF